jgi:hypothetical protein
MEGEKKQASLPNHLVRLRQSFCLNTNTKTGCWKSNTRTTKTKILLFKILEFLFFLCVCPPHLLVDFFGFLYLFFFFFFFLSFFLCFVSFTIVKLANTKLRTNQEQKQHQVEWWENKKGMETTVHSPQHKLIQDSEGTEENVHSAPDSNKTKINYNKEPKEAHKNTWNNKSCK